ncbi:MAG: hypothetical protein ACLFM4_14120 [Phormidium sp.]
MKPKLWKYRFLIIANVVLIPGWLIGVFLANTMSRDALANRDQYSENIYQDFPPREPSSFALELEAWAESSDVYQLQDRLDRYLRQVFESGDRRVPDIPQELQRYLNQNQAELSQIRDRLAQEETLDLGLPYDVRNYSFSTQFPNFWLLNRLSQLMMLRILEHHQAGEINQAEASFRAIFNLNNSLEKNPDFASQATIEENYKNLLSLSRQLDYLPETIAPKLEQAIATHQTSNLFNLQFDTYFYSLAWTDKIMVEDVSPMVQLLWLVARPYLNLIAAEVWKLESQLLEEMQTLDICRLTPQGLLEVIPATHWSFINDVGREEYLFQWWVRPQQLQFALELSQNLQQIKDQARREGQFPEAIAPIRSSSCDESQWVYEVNSDETATIRLENIPNLISEFGSPSYDTHHTIVTGFLAE